MLTIVVLTAVYPCAFAMENHSFSLVGGSYEDAVLTKTTTYGKLTFKAKAIFGLSSSTCWLKGTVTGENDDIEVTWQM